MGKRGKKVCPKCSTEVGARTLACPNCSYKWGEPKTQPKKEVAYIKMVDENPKVKFPGDKDFSPLTDWYSCKTIDKVVSMLEELPANENCRFKIVKSIIKKEIVQKEGRGRRECNHCGYINGAKRQICSNCNQTIEKKENRTNKRQRQKKM